MSTSGRRSSSIRLDSLLVAQTFSKSSFSTEENSFRTVSGVLEGVGIHGLKAHTFQCPNVSMLESILQNIERPNVSDRYLDPRSWEADCTPLFKGRMDGLLFTRYHSGKTSVSGCLDEVVLDANLRVRRPEAIDRALDAFADRRNFDLRHWQLSGVEAALQWWSPMTGRQMAGYWGPYRGQSSPVPYNWRSANPDPDGTHYYKTFHPEGHVSDPTDPLKRYDVSKKYLERYGIYIEGPEPDLRLFRFERTLTSDLWIPDANGKAPEDDEEQIPLTVGDLTKPEVYTYLISRLVSTFFGIDKNGITVLPVEKVKGHRKTVLKERALALAALNNFTEAGKRSEKRAGNRSYRQRLQRRHGDILDPQSYWGHLHHILMDHTVQDVPHMWEKFFRTLP